MTRKKITALTLIDTLSRVMTSWGATSMATVRRLTFTILSTKGISRMTPGPLALVGNEAPQPEDDGPLVLAQDLDRRRQDEEREDQDRHDVEGGLHASSWQRQAGWPDARSTRS